MTPSSLRHGDLAGKLFPAPDDHVAVFGIELNQPRLPAPSFSQAISVVPEPPKLSSTMSRALAVVNDSAFHQLDRLHGRMQFVLLRLFDKPHVALVARAAPEVIRALLPAVEDGFVLALVVGAAKRERILRPYDKGRPFAAPPR